MCSGCCGGGGTAACWPLSGPLVLLGLAAAPALMDAARPPPAKPARFAAVLSDRPSGAAAAAAGTTTPSCGFDDSLMEMLHTCCECVGVSAGPPELTGAGPPALTASASMYPTTLTRPAHGWCRVPPHCLLLEESFASLGQSCRILPAHCAAAAAAVTVQSFLLHYSCHHSISQSLKPNI